MGSFTNLIQQLPPNNDGKDFERLSKWILETAPQYISLVEQVWLWDEWSDKWGPDTGKTKSKPLFTLIRKSDLRSSLSVVARAVLQAILFKETRKNGLR
jgi:hypothetical protein